MSKKENARPPPPKAPPVSKLSKGPPIILPKAPKYEKETESPDIEGENQNYLSESEGSVEYNSKKYGGKGPRKEKKKTKSKIDLPPIENSKVGTLPQIVQRQTQPKPIQIIEFSLIEHLDKKNNEFTSELVRIGNLFSILKIFIKEIILN